MRKRKVTYPKKIITRITLEELEHISNRGNRSKFLRDLIQSDMRLNKARGIALTLSEMDILLREKL